MHRPITGAWAKVFALTTLVIAATHAPAGFAQSPWVDFYSASTTPSTLRQVVSRARGEVVHTTTGTPLRGLIAIPAGKGPFPAVVLMHDCRGLRGYQREWLRKLANWGYVALLVGSFYRGGADLHRSRNALEVCSQMRNWPGFDVTAGRVFDAYGALEYLAGLKQVDMSRVGLISWDRDSSLSTVNEAGFQAYAGYRFAAAVAITPSCRYSARGRFSTPVLLLAAGRDDWTSLATCQRMVKASQGTNRPVTMRALSPKSITLIVRCAEGRTCKIAYAASAKPCCLCVLTSQLACRPGSGHPEEVCCADP